MIKRIIGYGSMLVLLWTSPKHLKAQDRLYKNTFSLHDVKLLDGPFKHAMDLNADVLLEYDVDRLLAPFLKQAGLPAKAKSFDNWIGLDGHVGGHYLSALAIHYAATGRQDIKDRMDYVLSELKRCQQASGNGYVGGVPDGKHIWDEVRDGNPGIVWKYWVPWYNLHKTYAGLRDAWNYGQSEEAKDMFLKLCDWGLGVIASLDDKQMEEMLGQEFGGINEVYADAYQITGDRKYLDAAKRFSHKELFDSMAQHIDNLDNKHANTQVPKAVGYQRVAELSAEDRYVSASEFFWDRVANYRSIAIGGNSRREHFPEATDSFSYLEDREGPETCNTNNMLKLTEGLFRMKPEAKYVDFYEHALYNHILSSQHPEHGGYVYFTSARPRHYRVYSAPNQAMWCCVGTGMENHGKYGEFIYSHAADDLYVNLFIASELSWEEKGVSLLQETNFPEEASSKLTLKMDKPTRFKLLIRHPGWVNTGEMDVLINGKNYAKGSAASSYVAIEREWKDGDVINLVMPMHNTLIEMPNVPSYVSLMHGPILLAAKTGTEDLKGLIAGEDRWAHIASGKLLPLNEAPLSIGSRQEVQAKIDAMEVVDAHKQQFKVPGLFTGSQADQLVFEPFYKIHDSRYLMYWQSLTQADYDHMQAEQAREEREKLELEERTVDAVTPGEQQPEIDHQMQAQGSKHGNAFGEGFRNAQGDDAFFRYNLLTKGENKLSLWVRYWGNETGNRTFDILVDGQLLATENLADKWKKKAFINVEYVIPSDLLKNKDDVVVTFKPRTGQVAGRVFKVRLVKSK